MKVYLACVLGTLLTLGAVATAHADAPAKTDVVPALQKGGYVLFIRHPKTNQDQADTDPLHIDNVKAQRQLSDEGRKQVKDLGEAFRALKIPVATVLASKFWRAQEAATLLAVGKVEASLDLSEGGLVVSPNENQRRAQALRKLLGTAPPPGKNLVIVSHKPNLQDAAGKDLGDVAEAEVVIFQPLGESKSKVMARVPAAVWTDWSK
jgi:phosphohistidine phosphatase SixA